MANESEMGAPLISLNQEDTGDLGITLDHARAEEQEKVWSKAASSKAFVRGKRPQSAPMSRKKLSRVYSLHDLPSGNEGEASRSKLWKGKSQGRKSAKTKKKSTRPSTAPLRGRSATRENISKQLLRKELKRRDMETAKMLHEVKEQQELYNRGCIAKMHEATRYAQALNLGKKYNPIHIAAQADSDQYSINHKELRCEVVARDERYSRIISCQMFMREYAKLVKMHRKAALEIEDKSKQARTASENPISSEPTSKSPYSSALPSGKRTCTKDTENELRLLLQETKELTTALKDQMKLIKSCGWNLQLH